jgi:TolB protein
MRHLYFVVLATCLALPVGPSIGANRPYTVAYAGFGPLNAAIYIADADGSHEHMVIGGSVVDMNPSFTSDGQSILFTSRRNGSADIYRVAIDGSRLERLTDDPAFDDQAVMSPDGRSIAFVSSRSGQADIWILDVVSKRVRNVTNHPGGDYRPAWSPDGQWIAFTSDRDSSGSRASTPLATNPTFGAPQTTELYAIREDGSALRRLTDGTTSVGGAAWSPDGTRVCFYEADPGDWRSMNTDLPGPAATSQIVSMEVSTGARQVLTSGPGRKYAPKWIRKTIAYTRGAVGETRGERQRVVPVPESVRFTDGRPDVVGTYSNVNWSPDGRRMVFHRALEEAWPPLTPTFSRDAQFRTMRTGVFPSYSHDGRQLMSNTAYAGIFKNNIMLMNPDGTKRRVIFEHPNESALAPAWSPDDRYIAFGLGAFFLAGRNGASAHLAVIAADGTGLRMRTSGSGNYGFPSWSPEGRRLVARSSSGRSKNLVIIDVSTGAITPLTAGPQNDNFPAWSPKGDRILFTSDRDGDWELYTIGVDGHDLRRLTVSPGNDAHATWSHDGEWIAFASARGGFKDEMPVGEGGGQGAGDIFVMRADGSDVRRLTDDAFEEATPAFAPRR